MSPARVLLVEPDFPIPPKSRNHHNFLPVGLLKLAALLRNQGVSVKLARGLPKTSEELNTISSFAPEEVWVTTLFTYWAPHVKAAIEGYRSLVPRARFVVGGIYASLFPVNQVLAYTGCDEVVQGVVEEAESLVPAYDLLEEYTGRTLDYQILHASRGCPRRCRFCGTWKLEPQFRAEKSIRDKIVKRNLVFYDNNLLMNPHIDSILDELAELRRTRRIGWCESQSGFDGRILAQRPELAAKLRAAGFRNPRIAWDHGIEQQDLIRGQLSLLEEAGYSLSKDVYVFMLYNWHIPFSEVEAKRVRCWEWKVQISDCRYRPLDQLFDNYRGGITQDHRDYHIHASSGWTDQLVKQFRRNVREQNICVRHGFPFYSRALERKQQDLGLTARDRKLMPVHLQMEELRRRGVECWVPGETRWPAEVSDVGLVGAIASN